MKTPRTDAALDCLADDQRGAVSYNGPTFIDFARTLELELSALHRELDGIRNNAPKCGACAEALFCGSVMHQHDPDCAYTELSALQRSNAELVEFVESLRPQKDCLACLDSGPCDVCMEYARLEGRARELLSADHRTNKP